MSGKPVITKKSASHYKQGIFKPKNPQKYRGDVTNIIYRSKWEHDFMVWCDRNPAVISYSSEELVIPYLFPLDGKMHHYYVDFCVEVMQIDGKIQKYAIEIKPHSETVPPRTPLRTRKTLQESQITYSKSMVTYIKNRAKWESASKFCAAHNMIFKVLTEKELYKHGK